MINTKASEVQVLKLSLHGRLVGYLSGFKNGKNVLNFADEFKYSSDRPTLSLITHSAFPHSEKLLADPWRRNQRLHPVLSNMLPEGSLRELIAQSLKTHVDNEFYLFSYLGADLPGALIAQPLAPGEVPDAVLSTHGAARAVKFEQQISVNKFSLAGVQMKFSVKEKDGRYNFATGNILGDWIVKTPSTKHKDVPLNEYTAMQLAKLAGVDIPEIKLVELSHFDNLPPINLPDEKFAFAIKRFDRNQDTRIHMEDFSQVLVKYPHEKYSSANYEQIARIINDYSGGGLADVQQLARRLLVNILLANGDAHLKNWSLIYTDQITPRLSPAYDILTTRVYIEGERHLALNLAKTKDWYEISMQSFEHWAERSGVSWRMIKPHLDDVIEKARDLWPQALESLPMNDQHKRVLQVHWQELHQDFRLGKG